MYNKKESHNKSVIKNALVENVEAEQQKKSSL